MSGFFYSLLLIVLFILPYVVLYYTPSINQQLKTLNLKVKLPDILNFYLVVGLYIFSSLAFSSSVFLYFLIIVSLIGIGLVTYYVYILNDFHLGKFIRVWWRFVFLVAFVFYTICGLVSVFKLLFG